MIFLYEMLYPPPQILTPTTGLFWVFFFFLVGGGFWPCFVACGILVPLSGIRPVPPALEAQSQSLDLQGSPPTQFWVGGTELSLSVPTSVPAPHETQGLILVVPA